jgi:hypothetical protein
MRNASVSLPYQTILMDIFFSVIMYHQNHISCESKGMSMKIILYCVYENTITIQFYCACRVPSQIPLLKHQVSSA